MHPVLERWSKIDYTSITFDQTKAESALSEFFPAINLPHIKKFTFGGYLEQQLAVEHILTIFPHKHIESFYDEYMRRNRYFKLFKVNKPYWNTNYYSCRMEANRFWNQDRRKVRQTIHASVLSQIHGQLILNYRSRYYEYSITRNAVFGLTCLMGGLDQYKNIPQKEQHYIKICLLLAKAFEAGVWLLYPLKDHCLVVTRPGFRFRTEGRREQPHWETGPAAYWTPSELHNERYFFWKGIEIPEWTFEDVSPLKGSVLRDRILREHNAERRRCMVEKIGYDKFLKITKPTILDKTDKGILYNFGTSLQLQNNRRVESTHVLRVTDPSTGREYFLGVRPSCDTVDQARASTFDLSGTEFHPLQET